MRFCFISGDMAPVLVDDIVSTARTMIAAAQHVRAAGLPPPVCIAVHALFAEDAFSLLQASGVARIVSCDTVMHPTNEIDLSPHLQEAVADVLGKLV
jgi:ribose-phosphate pyrophosphokinase